MSTYERSRLKALGIKQQVSDGVDAIAGSPVAADFLDAEFSISPDVDMIPDPSFTASLDPRPPMPGGARFTIRGVRVPLRGSGTAGTEPEWFRVLRTAGMVQVNTAAAVGAPTAATAGTATTATLATPFAATADLYRGMPVILSGNPATATPALITDYTAGRLATFSRTFAPILSTATLAQIPINNLLRLTDTETDFQRFTCYAYQAGQLYIGTDCIALGVAFELARGGPGFLVFDIVGVLAAASPTEQALPAAAATVTRPTPPQWRGGESQLGRALGRAQSAAFRLGSSGTLPPNPEAANGFDAAQLTGREPMLDLTMMANSTASPTRVAAMRAGTDTLYSAILGSVAGNRLGFLFSPGRIARFEQTSVDGLDADRLMLAASLPGGSLMVSAF